MPSRPFINFFLLFISIQFMYNTVMMFSVNSSKPRVKVQSRKSVRDDVYDSYDDSVCPEIRSRRGDGEKRHLCELAQKLWYSWSLPAPSYWEVEGVDASSSALPSKEQVDGIGDVCELRCAHVTMHQAPEHGQVVREEQDVAATKHLREREDGD